ncbi:hypothetical protein EYC80_000625 [Monilinia laxa]|uniref:Uncharacterized protein n=1 Tax=Monilinia laxa TaxID=61186 RepID=A0A5N6KBC5_MONLA|nr:hypothetical protein EYC80_000625 [Monilinia laxa]
MMINVIKYHATKLSVELQKFQNSKNHVPLNSPSDQGNVINLEVYTISFPLAPMYACHFVCLLVRLCAILSIRVDMITQTFLCPARILEYLPSLLPKQIATTVTSCPRIPRHKRNLSHSQKKQTNVRNREQPPGGIINVKSMIKAK